MFRPKIDNGPQTVRDLPNVAFKIFLKFIWGRLSDPISDPKVSNKTMDTALCDSAWTVVVLTTGKDCQDSVSTMDKHDTRELIAILFLDKVRSVPPFLIHRTASHLLSLEAQTAVLVSLYQMPWRLQKPVITILVRDYGLVSVILVNPSQISDIDGQANCSFVN